MKTIAESLDLLICFLFFNRFAEIYFTYYVTYPLKLCNSVVFSIFLELHNHNQSILEHFYHPKRNPIPPLPALPNPHISPAPDNLKSTSFL